MRGKSITIDPEWFDLISKYADEHYMTKKDTLSMLLDIAIGRNQFKDTFREWHLKQTT
jgi:hypothetical protein